MATYKRGLQTALIQYIAQHPNHLATLSEIQEKVPGWPKTSYSSAMAEICRKHPDVVARLSASVWEWQRFGSGVVEPEPVTRELNEMLIKVLTRKDGKLLVTDEDSGELYVMERFSL